MNPTDAEEYTQALGQVTSGAWRQIALGSRLGVPQALGLSTSEWVECHLGGYMRLGITERREAVQELTAPVEAGGMGLSQRQAGEVLGVAVGTVNSDLSVQNRTPAAPDLGSNGQSVQNRTPGPDRADYVALQWLGNMRSYVELAAKGLEDEKVTRALAAGGKLPSIRAAKKIVATLERLS